ncbi:MAG: CvpA family protein [Dehalococcoidia bacterium]|nr:CvpA family protein [Dehalococcoidia bacterium]
MNWLDVAIVIAIVWFTFAAFRAGFIREVVAVIAVVVGVLAAGFYYDDLARDVLLFIDNDKAANVMAFLVLFGALALAGQLAAILLKHMASLLLLGQFDHLAGAAFGLLKGLILVEVFLILFTTYPYLGLGGAIRGSAIAPLFLDRGPILVNLLPGEFDRAVEAF